MFILCHLEGVDKNVYKVSHKVDKMFILCNLEGMDKMFIKCYIPRGGQIIHNIHAIPHREGWTKCL